MYKAVEYFTDLQDNSYAYNIDDTYPREGYEPSKERIAELSGSGNLRGRAVIAEVIEVAPVIEEISEEVPEEIAEKPKKRGKRSE